MDHIWSVENLTSRELRQVSDVELEALDLNAPLVSGDRSTAYCSCCDLGRAMGKNPSGVYTRTINALFGWVRASGGLLELSGSEEPEEGEGDVDEACTLDAIRHHILDPEKDVGNLLLCPLQ